jgi:hypothetical protein
MKSRVKMLVAAVVVGGVMWGAGAQTPPITASSTAINLNSSQISLKTGYAEVDVTSRVGPYAGYSRALLNGDVISINGNSIWITPIGGTTNYGNFQVSGGSKFFIHPHLTDDSKAIRYICTESGESLTLARGIAKTENGQITVELPEHFSMVTSKDAPITVIITPEGAPVLLYTKQKSSERIVVAMKESDFVEFKDVEFSYQVTGVRDGFEKIETIVNVDDLEKAMPAREDVQKRIDGLIEKMKEKFEVKVEE